MLQCVVRPRGRGREKVYTNTAQITGEGRNSYLSSLSTSLSQMQPGVNTFLTQLVEEEKAAKMGSTHKKDGACNTDEGMQLKSLCLTLYNHVFL